MRYLQCRTAHTCSRGLRSPRGTPCHVTMNPSQGKRAQTAAESNKRFHVRSCKLPRAGADGGDQAGTDPGVPQRPRSSGDAPLWSLPTSVSPSHRTCGSGCSRMHLRLGFPAFLRVTGGGAHTCDSGERGGISEDRAEEPGDSERAEETGGHARGRGRDRDQDPGGRDHALRRCAEPPEGAERRQGRDPR